MNHVKAFDNYKYSSILIIVDVQKSFKKYFSDNYLIQLKEYCKEFDEVFQIWDNHINGRVSSEYLFDDEPDILLEEDLYHFPNQTEIIEKRYNYDVDVDFYKKILDKTVHKDIKSKQEDGTLKKGDAFETTRGTVIVYIGNKHKWHHVSKKLYNRIIKNKHRKFVIVGGSSVECLQDVYISCKSLGVDIMKNNNYIYSAKNCPIS